MEIVPVDGTPTQTPLPQPPSIPTNTPTGTPTNTPTSTPTSVPDPSVPPTTSPTATLPVRPEEIFCPVPTTEDDEDDIETIIDTVTQITYIEAGASPYVRPDDDETFRKAVQSIAFIVRNRVEFGVPWASGTGVQKARTYRETYTAFQAYTDGSYANIGPSSANYQFVRSEVERVMRCEVSDWTGGALFNLPYDYYHNNYETNQHLSQSVVWQRADTGKFWAVYLFKTLPVPK